MTLTQAVVSYAIVFIALLIGLGFSLWRYKTSWPKLPRLPVIKVNWRERFGKELHHFADGDFWLKVLLSTFIALCAGVSVATFMIPYGSWWMVIGLIAALLLLAVLLPYLLA